MPRGATTSGRQSDLEFFLPHLENLPIPEPKERLPATQGLRGCIKVTTDEHRRTSITDKFEDLAHQLIVPGPGITVVRRPPVDSNTPDM